MRDILPDKAKGEPWSYDEKHDVANYIAMSFFRDLLSTSRHYDLPHDIARMVADKLKSITHNK
jgi:hypothetical protein